MTERRRVRVWFGDLIIATYEADSAVANRYAETIARRFAGLGITNDPLPAGANQPPAQLPAERLWPLTVR